MGLRINTNIASMNAQRNLAAITARLAVNFRRLSTGLRIGTAADDAAGLAISERLRAQITSLQQAQRNANDGVSMAQTAEGAMGEVNNILVRLRELTVEAANGTTSDADRATLGDEFHSLVLEVDRIGRSTQFNGIHLLDGSTSSVMFQVGYGNDPNVDGLSLSLSPILSTTLNLSSLDIGCGSDISLALHNIDAAIDSVSSARGRIGAVQNRLGYTIDNLGNQVENLSAAESRIRDVDIARETADLARNQILQQAAIAVLAQANSQPQLALRLLGIG